ncbi:hypothetical protein BW897_11035 [Bacillus cereus]|uniref:TFIIS central domain-containing protein n=1 Tax=Bacillus cereus TaxID=1396 RepID=A0A1S9TSE0_BACCE|nr:hypothetical protein [Bacillus cereus]OOR12639.1 hypothetical protein BW897_11035 [Bacillus cereus]
MEKKKNSSAIEKVEQKVRDKVYDNNQEDSHYWQKRIDELEDHIDKLYEIILFRGQEYAKAMTYLQEKGLGEEYKARLKEIEARLTNSDKDK